MVKHKATDRNSEFAVNALGDAVKIELIEAPSETDVASLYDGLHAFNLQHIPNLNEISLGLFIRNNNEEIVGGAIGTILPAVMQIKYLWLAEYIRGQGIGKNIVQRLENEASARGLQSITLETYTFQAPAFYTKLGFHEVGSYINYPSSGIDKIFYQKNLCIA